MDYPATIKLLKQRMEELGISSDRYHYEPVPVTGTPAQRKAFMIEIPAFNEYYYLVNERDLNGIQIMSDTGYYNSDKPHLSTLPEFSGQIFISPLSVIAPWNIGSQFNDGSYKRIRWIEFLKVTIH